MRFLEDKYEGWIKWRDFMSSVTETHQNLKDGTLVCSVDVTSEKKENVLSFVHSAMEVQNVYLWGGTAGPNYDCSGLSESSLFWALLCFLLNSQIFILHLVVSKSTKSIRIARDMDST